MSSEPLTVTMPPTSVAVPVQLLWFVEGLHEPPASPFEVDAVLVLCSRTRTRRESTPVKQSPLRHPVLSVDPMYRQVLLQNDYGTAVLVGRSCR